MNKLSTFVLGLCVALLGLVGWASAATVTFNRNNDAITTEYNAWACKSLNCVVLKSSATLLPIVIQQTAAGVMPTFQIDLTGISGSLAISAKRASGEESGLSVPVNFTAPPATVAAPAVPTGVVIQ